MKSNHLTGVAATSPSPRRAKTPDFVWAVARQFARSLSRCLFAAIGFGLLASAGCGGGSAQSPQATPSPVAVAGNWSYARTQTAASHAQCGAVGNALSESWLITQAAGSASFAVAATVNVGGEQRTYAATQLNNGTFSASEEKITSLAGRCFVARTTVLTGAFNAGATAATGTATVTLKSDPPEICEPLGQPPTCTGAYTFTLQKQ